MYGLTGAETEQGGGALPRGRLRDERRGQSSMGARQSYRVGSSPRSDGSAHGRTAYVVNWGFYLRMSRSRDRVRSSLLLGKSRTVRRL